MPSSRWCSRSPPDPAPKAASSTSTSPAVARSLHRRIRYAADRQCDPRPAGPAVVKRRAPTARMARSTPAPAPTPSRASAGILVNTVRGPERNGRAGGRIPRHCRRHPAGLPRQPDRRRAVPGVDQAVRLRPALDRRHGADPDPRLRRSWAKPPPSSTSRPPTATRPSSASPPGSGTIVVNVVAELRSDEDYGIERRLLQHAADPAGLRQLLHDLGHAERRRARRPALPEPRIGQLPEENCMTNEEILAAGGKEVAFLSNPVDCAEEALRPPSVTLNANLWQNPGLTFTSQASLPAVTGCDRSCTSKATWRSTPRALRPTARSPFTTEPHHADRRAARSRKADEPDDREDGRAAAGRASSSTPRAPTASPPAPRVQIGYKGGDFPLPNPMRFDKQPEQLPRRLQDRHRRAAHAADRRRPERRPLPRRAGRRQPLRFAFAVYLAIEDPRHGITIKLPGKVETDPSYAARSRSPSTHLPPYPVERLDLTLKGGDRSALASPQTCGTYTTKTTFTPWSAPESGPPTVSASQPERSTAARTGRPARPPSRALPFDLGFEAGTTDPVAGRALALRDAHHPPRRRPEPRPLRA